MKQMIPQGLYHESKFCYDVRGLVSWYLDTRWRRFKIWIYLKFEKNSHVISCWVVLQLQESMKHDSSPDCRWMIACQSTDLIKTPHELANLGMLRAMISVSSSSSSSSLMLLFWKAMARAHSTGTWHKHRPINHKSHEQRWISWVDNFGILQVVVHNRPVDNIVIVESRPILRGVISKELFQEGIVPRGN